MVNLKTLFVLSFILVAGCFPTTNVAINKIDVGMTKKQVTKVMGKPYSTNAFYNKDFFVYYVHEDFIDLFISKKFPFIGFYPIIRTGTEYWIVLENARVVSYGEARHFKNNVPNALSSKGMIVFEK